MSEQGLPIQPLVKAKTLLSALIKDTTIQAFFSNQIK